METKPISESIATIHHKLIGFRCLIFRDLVGNIITTMACCLIVGQVANLMRIYTEFHNHINFLIMGLFELHCSCRCFCVISF